MGRLVKTAQLWRPVKGWDSELGISEWARLRARGQGGRGSELMGPMGGRALS